MCALDCDGCGCHALEQGDDAVPGLCLLVPCLLLGLDLAIHMPGDGLSSSPPALLAML